MNTPIDLRTAHIIKTGTLKKSSEPYTLILLSSQHIEQMLSLQNTVFDSLPAEKQSFLLKKSKDFFEHHFAEGFTALGIVHNNQLIAQSIIIDPTAENPRTGMVDMTLDAGLDKITVLQGVVVRPDYLGNNLTSVMVNEWLDISRKRGRTDAISEVAVDNHFSWSAFMKEGLHIHSLGKDPADGTEVYNLHARTTAPAPKRLKNIFNKKSVKCRKGDLQKQKELLAKGYRGIHFEPANDTIEFKPPKKVRKTFGKLP